MVALNDVYGRLRPMISAARRGLPGKHDPEEGEMVFSDSRPWFGRLAWEWGAQSGDNITLIDEELTLLQATVAIDEYELARAIPIFSSFVNRNLLKKIKKPTCFTESLAWDAEKAGILLCNRLRAASLDDEAAEIASLVREAMSRSWGAHYKTPKLDEVMRLDRRPNVNPLHPRQRANWEHLTGRQASGGAARMTAARQSEADEFIDAIASIGGFLSLQADPPIPKPTPVRTNRVPEPSLFGGPLLPEQSGEYHRAFYVAPSFNLTKKYLPVRSKAWFESLFDDGIDLARLLNEILVVAKFLPATFRRTPPLRHIDSLVAHCTFLDFMDFLKTLPISAAKKSTSVASKNRSTSSAISLYRERGPRFTIRYVRHDHLLRKFRQVN
jgi:hypothetical protein